MDVGIKYVRKAKTDAYMLTHYKKRKLKTKIKVIEEGGRPVDWNQEFWLPAQIPVIQGRIVMKLMDRDDVFDETVGSLFFDLNEIIEEFKTQGDNYKPVFQWKNIYGSPMNQSDTDAKK